LHIDAEVKRAGSDWSTGKRIRLQDTAVLMRLFEGANVRQVRLESGKGLRCKLLQLPVIAILAIALEESDGVLMRLGLHVDVEGIEFGNRRFFQPIHVGLMSRRQDIRFIAADSLQMGDRAQLLSRSRVVGDHLIGELFDVGILGLVLCETAGAYFELSGLFRLGDEIVLAWCTARSEQDNEREKS
jgi:hypothetical protein